MHGLAAMLLGACLGGTVVWILLARRHRREAAFGYASRDVQDLKRLIKLTVAPIENSEERTALAARAQVEKSTLAAALKLEVDSNLSKDL